jgi:hypothetical protein
MSWIKRNLFFVIGSVIALALIGGAGVYTYLQWNHNATARGERDKEYAELARLYGLEPNPGNEKVNNIKAARDQQEQIRAFVVKARKFFERVPPIPGAGRITGEAFTTALSKTIAQMQHDAANASVMLRPKWNFSFSVQSDKVKFQGSLEPLAVQLGEVKAICGILFQAKINNLDSLRRERVSVDDQTGPQTDYLDQPSVTNELAVLTPYEIEFRCFSGELASVLSGFASSPFPMLVKAINVEPATGVGEGERPGALTLTPTMPVAPGPAAQPPAMAAPPPTRPAAPPIKSRDQRVAEARMQAERDAYQKGTYAQTFGGGTKAPTPALRVPAPAPGPMQPGLTPPPSSASAPQGGLDEKPLRVTMLIYIVKLLPQK